jgi:hypothetical protein
VDASTGTVGRRYSRADELGVPFGVTIDFQTLLDRSVTVRDRDSMAQVRVPAGRLVSLLVELTAESLSWAQVMDRFLVVNPGGEAAEQALDEEPATPSPASSSSARVVVEHSPRARFSRPNVRAVEAK